MSERSTFFDLQRKELEGDKDMIMGGGDHERRVIICSSTNYKIVFGVLAVWWLIWLLLVGTIIENIGSGGTRQRNLSGAAAPNSGGGGDLKKVEMVANGENGRKVEVVGAGKILHHPELDLNYMNKRKVPNGPDPIHNRKTGNSGRPPGQA